MKRAAAAAAAALLTFVSSPSRAADSEQGPLYVQGSVGISFWDFPNRSFLGVALGGYAWTGFDPSIEVGYHISGRHDGFVVGLRQSFVITAIGYTGAAAGTTVARIGYDVPLKLDKVEVNIDPFATVGAGYIFDYAHAGITSTGGIDVKVFFAKGIYAFARPAELGIQCFEDTGTCAFAYLAAVGAGFAFGQ
jgi:hypothetical protein